MAFQPGDTVGDYEILGVLGSGGMGRVFRVRNVLSDRLEAMKIVLPNAAPTPDSLNGSCAKFGFMPALSTPI